MNRNLVAIYGRLSKEDQNKINENDFSESIQNQKLILSEYCAERGWTIYDFYMDDDFTGSDRNRPEFNRLLDDAKNKKFNIILCKTQSRFTREIEIAERYINYLLPLWGIRFISVVDGADTYNKSNIKSRQINSLVNEWYLADLSDNIKKTMAAKRKAGLWVGSLTPYGYIKDPENKNHLIVDEEAAKVVKYIFRLYLDGYGFTPIARKLNEENILNPRAYKVKKGILRPSSISNPNSTLWSSFTVSGILSNEIYIGNTVQGVRESISYKSKKVRIKDKSDWVIVPNTHEAIIDKETFSLVSKLKVEKRPSVSLIGITKGIFSYKLRCAKCGASMRSSKAHGERYYRCNGKNFKPSSCEGTLISHKQLYNEILYQIQSLCNQYGDNEIISDNINIVNTYAEKCKQYKSNLSILQQKIEQFDTQFTNLYIDKNNAVISLEQFTILSNELVKHKNELIAQYDLTKSKIKEYEDKERECSNVIDLIHNYRDVKELDKPLIDEFIDFIEIGGKSDWKRNKNIIIHWNF